MPAEPLRQGAPRSSAHERRAWDRRCGDLALDPWREHDACGVGFVARATGTRSHEILRLALTAVARLAHRGAASNDHSGDGAGVLTQIPHRLLAAVEGDHPCALGMFFLPPPSPTLERAVALIEEAIHGLGMPILGWRDVPVDATVLGPLARASQPTVRQALVGAPPQGGSASAWERRLYLARRVIERRAAEQNVAPCFVCSLSNRTVVYKALLTGTELPAFYPDLRSPLFETAIAVFHQRYSTNTLPSWPLAQPFRLLAHNGEINTLWGNRNAMRAREGALGSPLWGRDIEHLKPVIWAQGSDSASLDNAYELLVRSGRDPVHALMMLVPEAWQRVSDLDPALQSFYEFHAGLMEPWDGPAALAFTDGVTAGSAVDRNGLRPCRYKVTAHGLVVACSEVGVADLDPADVVESGRLGPGELLVVDTARGAVLRSADAKREVARRYPYRRWLDSTVRDLPHSGLAPGPARPPADLARSLRAFGYSFEDLRYVLAAMAGTGQDAIWSMGDDTSIAPLSRVPQTLYAYFRQRFAQVTNPPIDPLREARVMSLVMYLGRRGSLLAQRPTARALLRLEHPVLLEEEMGALRRAAGFPVGTLSAVWEASSGAAGLVRALEALSREAARAVRGGAATLVLSDRDADARRAPIPMLLAIGAVHQHLLRAGLRTRVGLVAEAGDAWDIHHFAALVGYGAEAVHPWLALESLTAAPEPAPDAEASRHKFRAAAEKGLLKIVSKMGISTLQSYAGAQVFEALGVGADVIDRCFAGTASVIGGIGFGEIAEDVLARHAAAYGEAPSAAEERLPDHGRIRYRKDGEDHGWAPPLVRALQDAVRSGGADGSTYGTFVTRVEARGPAGPRDLVAFRPAHALPLVEVEPVEAIRRRFISSAMSLGALSPEAHATLAIGMNRMGARSNSGEGGEDPATYVPLFNGDRTDNRIKQVASARFGVTTEYLVRADELEIKIAQGSKPGEGGQLPGHKVTALIARLRHAVAGIPLISPPPHHDIYSIEDLAQLIHDLKQVNPAARVGVKLVAEAGVGTVAAGVAKAYADYVLIAGHNGGTGASPLSSIKHAGLPWELGLAETQAVLLENGLRERVEVRVDGGLRTGRDVVLAALLGAEAFGFGTAAVVAIGCAMARQCHINTCPTGIATQRPELRQKFRGTPEQVVAFFTLVAEDVRRILAALGFRTLDDIVGRVELLERLDRPECPRAALLDLATLLAPPRAPDRPRRRTVARNVRPGVASLDVDILKELQGALERGEPFAGAYAIGNHHLSVGARIAGHIARRYGMSGPPAPVRLRFRGSAGQSFGAFALPGMRLRLEGEANDHVGKGLCGGEIVIRPFRTAAYAGEGESRQHVILGNTALYGATGGLLFAAGAAGDRFAVRNSGAVAVIEGAGDHCCEYMTGGVVVVLGPVGRNFGAGMSNGVAYLLDEGGTLLARSCNLEMVAVMALDPTDERRLKALIHRHYQKTGSRRARHMLQEWESYRRLLRKVAPPSAAVAGEATREVATGRARTGSPA
ncbi:MAG: glutamate synthase large subunit [Gemmatimonadetes bacterium]|nr:glutamate synthase large subunit [Gemmatimonadota bacterium]